MGVRTDDVFPLCSDGARVARALGLGAPGVFFFSFFLFGF
jgi:hypothetical protein